MKKYNPQLTKSISWEEIEKGYLQLIEHGLKFEPMLNLVNHIQNSNLNERLFAFTSMHKLVVGIYDEIDWNREALHIEFDSETRKWLFKYRSKPFEPIDFERTYDEELGIEKFDQLIKNIKW